MDKKEAILNVRGMTCGGCERAVERALQSLAGVKFAQASHLKAQVVVHYDPAMTDLANLRKTVAAAGFTPDE